MAAEFHLFASLPTEIRLMIWERALRLYSSSRPAAHFFSVTNLKKDGDELTNLRVQCHRGSNCEYNHGETFCLAAPKFGSSHSWTNNNPSSYLWDFGMWSACWESREVIKDYYNLESWATKLWNGYNDYNDPDVDACVPFVFPRGDINWFFTIRPNQDLICLQPLNPDTIRSETIRPRRGSLFLMDDICMVNDNTGLRGIKHLAFEYDSSWWDDLTMTMFPQDFSIYVEEKTHRGLFLRTLMSMQIQDSTYAQDTIWLIDYGLKRNTQAHDDGGGRTGVYGRERMTFYGNDRKFVEVDRKSRNEYISTQPLSALDFLDVLDGMLDGYTPGHILEHIQGKYSLFICEICNDIGVVPPRLIDRDVRVLACERSE
ncbi:hypothetical protein GGI43DRAFT_388696 [Trichoderma evansii]